MTPSWRKPAGMLLILALLTAWCVGVASLSGWVGAWPWWLQLPFYIVAGVAWLWVLPLRRLLLWMDQGRFRAPTASAGGDTEAGPVDTAQR